MLVITVKIQTYGNDFLLGLRVVLLVLAGLICQFLDQYYHYVEGCPIVDSFIR